ncbi:MAG: phenylalanine 4-monooxygenase [Pigmentiphaga sp.]|uniref:phenylalanine 4-monooxygenase n=1 Tax=Pigmentiphaga sp. TaxID=1977564 RepID=UPI0029B8E29E|nr:phenylalanine 4-monooxygenase [Pigmentiphaga sp.]MDX3907833.1 phenylalanine 4-monooxygenase [Pigmentiphaga sp.]
MKARPASPKHGLAAGEAGRPVRADWTIDQDWEHYTAQEHALWKTLFERQARLVRGRACREFEAGLRDLPIDADRIPDFRRLSDVLARRTGWQVVAVPGLVPDEVFFDHLAHRRFPAGQFIRRPDQLDYLEEPDVFHDVFGHVPMLMHPVLADFVQAYGQGGLRAQRLGVLHHLARVYWYTVEFGLISQEGGLRIYGSGIISSHAESLFALDHPSPHRVRFDLERVMRTRYRIDDFQEIYFVLHDLDELLDLARIDFAPVYERVRRLPEIEPGELGAEDEVLARGTGAYAARAGRS